MCISRSYWPSFWPKGWFLLDHHYLPRNDCCWLNPHLEWIPCSIVANDYTTLCWISKSNLQKVVESIPIVLQKNNHFCCWNHPTNLKKYETKSHNSSLDGLAKSDKPPFWDGWNPKKIMGFCPSIGAGFRPFHGEKDAVGHWLRRSWWWNNYRWLYKLNNTPKRPNMVGICKKYDYLISFDYWPIHYNTTWRMNIHCQPFWYVPKGCKVLGYHH